MRRSERNSQLGDRLYDDEEANANVLHSVYPARSFSSLRSANKFKMLKIWQLLICFIIIPKKLAKIASINQNSIQIVLI